MTAQAERDSQVDEVGTPTLWPDSEVTLAVSELREMNPLAERFWPKVDKRAPNECWLWTGAINRGYGQFENRQAGRIAWELAIGPIPERLEIAHSCGQRRCCNPKHLELVTHLESQLRSPISFASINAAKTSCPRGHEYDHTTANGWRRCRACGRSRRATNSEFPLAAAG